MGSIEWIDLLVRIFVIGLGGWAIQWGIGQKIQALENKIPVLPDCNKIRKEVKAEIMQDCGNRLAQVHELIQKDLDTGKEKFKDYKESLKKIEQMVHDIELHLATIAKNGTPQQTTPFS